jgi:RND family efflux transporter MFP subunit
VETKNADLSGLRIDRSREESNPIQGKGAKKLFTVGVPLILIAAAVVALSRTVLDSPVNVKIVTAVIRSAPQTEALLTASGYVVAQRKAAVASKATGRLVYLGVIEGDKVKKGQIIARLEDSDVMAQLSESKANLELSEVTLADAKWNYERNRKLFNSGSITESTFESSETQYKKAQASVDVAKANVQAAEVSVENTLVRAPFDGTVLTKNADVGEIVAPMAGSINARGTVATIADMASLQVESDVSESNIEKVKPGQDCQITLDAYPDVQYKGYVAKIVPTADRSKATVTVKVAFREYDGRVLPEMGAKVLFLKTSKANANGINDERPTLVLPSTAVVTRENQQVVFKIEDNKAVETLVTLGNNHGGFIEVKSGLTNGDQVIDSPSEQIRNGENVTLKQ